MFRLYRPITSKDLEEIVVDAICDGGEQDFSEEEPEDDNNRSHVDALERSGLGKLNCLASDRTEVERHKF